MTRRAAPRRAWCCPRASTATSGCATGGSPSSRCPGAETVSRGGWLVPGLVDAHCHVGIGRGGVPRRGPGRAARAGARRAGGRGAGAARLRLAGRHPRPGRRAGPAADHPRRPAHRRPAPLHPRARRRGGARPTWSPRSRVQARRGDGWVKLVGDWIDRGVGRPGARVAGRRAAPRPSPPRTRRAPGSPRTPSAPTRCPG